jgi:negative regulator of flagellin synthesis FlgM
LEVKMKIGQPLDNSVASSATTQSAATKGGQSAAATAAKTTQAAGVAVTVSTLARSLESVNRGQVADVDLKKVEAVKSAIQQGTYKVDAEAIADKLLSNAQEMLDRTRV